MIEIRDGNLDRALQSLKREFFSDVKKSLARHSYAMSRTELRREKDKLARKRKKNFNRGLSQSKRVSERS